MQDPLEHCPHHQPCDVIRSTRHAPGPQTFRNLCLLQPYLISRPSYISLTVASLNDTAGFVAVSILHEPRIRIAEAT